MVQIIQSPRRSAYAGQQAGTALGNALQGLAQNFVQDFAKTRQQQAFSEVYPQYAGLLSQFYGSPAEQVKLLQHLQAQDAQRAAQQEAGLMVDPEYLASRGYPRELIAQIDAAPSLKLKQKILESYHADLNKPIGIGEVLATKLGIPGTKSRLPGIGEERRREEQQQRQNRLYGYAQTMQQPGGIGQVLQAAQGDQSMTNVNPAPSPEGLSGLGRALLRPGLYASGLAEGALGLPGSLGAAATGLINLLPQLLTGQNLVEPYETLGVRKQEILDENINKLPISAAAKEQLKKSVAPQTKLLPTAAQARKGIIEPLAKATGTEKTFLPQNESEDAVAQVFTEAAPEVLTSLAGGGAIPIAKGIGKALSRAFGANIAGWTTQAITGSERAGNIVKLGTYLASSMFPVRMKEAAKREYGKWDEAIDKTKNKEVSLAPVQKKLMDVQDKVNALDRYSEGREFMEKRIASLEDITHLNESRKQAVNVDRLHKLRQSQNALYDKARKYKVADIFSEMLDAEKDLMGHWAQANNQQKAFKSFEEANEIYRSLAQQEQMKGVADSISKARSLSFGAGMVVGALPKIVKTALVGGAAAPAVYRNLRRIFTTPAFQKEYLKALRASAHNNIKAATLAISKLDRIAQKVAPDLVQAYEEGND